MGRRNNVIAAKSKRYFVDFSGDIAKNFKETRNNSQYILDFVLNIFDNNQNKAL